MSAARARAGASFEVVAPPGGALCVVQISARDEAACDAALRGLRLAPLATGAVALRDLGGIDTAIVARPAPDSIMLTPHAGPVVLTRLVRWLEQAGFERRGANPRARYPEASDLVEACMLDTLATAASPLAIDALLRQPDLWRASRWAGSPEPASGDAALHRHHHVLARLLVPPLVVGVGHTNIGKSTLVNALARRTVAIVADAPGTTRDHVGVVLDLAGLVVRWIDTPGVARTEVDAPLDPIEAAAFAMAREVLPRADLIVSCADATAPFLDAGALPSGIPLLTCATRADLAQGSVPPADVTTAAARAEGLETLARAVRDTLVPPALLESDIPWRFHPALSRPAPTP